MTTEDNNEAVEESVAKEEAVEEVAKKPRKKKAKYDAVQKDGSPALMFAYDVSILTGTGWEEYKIVAESQRIATVLAGWNGTDALIVEKSVYSP